MAWAGDGNVVAGTAWKCPLQAPPATGEGNHYPWLHAITARPARSLLCAGTSDLNRCLLNSLVVLYCPFLLFRHRPPWPSGSCSVSVDHVQGSRYIHHTHTFLNMVLLFVLDVSYMGDGL